jgi:CHASE3 domain sensor protein
MSDSPLLKNARRRLAEQRQREQERLEARLVTNRRAAIRNAVRMVGVVALIALIMGFSDLKQLLLQFR